MAKGVTLADEVAEVRRELALRERVFPPWVRSGRMTQDAADWRMACLRAVLVRLELAAATDG